MRFATTWAKLIEGGKGDALHDYYRGTMPKSPDDPVTTQRLRRAGQRLRPHGHLQPETVGTKRRGLKIRRFPMPTSSQRSSSRTIPLRAVGKEKRFPMIRCDFYAKLI
jgi:hypothetical protein